MPGFAKDVKRAGAERRDRGWMEFWRSLPQGRCRRCKRPTPVISQAKGQKAQCIPNLRRCGGRGRDCCFLMGSTAARCSFCVSICSGVY